MITGYDDGTDYFGGDVSDLGGDYFPDTTYPSDFTEGYDATSDTYGPSTIPGGNSAAGSGGFLSGLEDIFSAAGKLIPTITQAVSGPPKISYGPTGQASYFNPQTGKYEIASGLSANPLASLTSSPLLLFAGLGLVTVLLLRNK